MGETSSGRHVVLVPVKPLATAKSRLGLPDGLRRELAAAFAEDTVTACLASASVAEVLVVTDDAGLARHLAAEQRCTVLPDGAGGDLNATLVQAAREADRRWPGLTPVAVCADLPALRGEDLDAALGARDAGRAAFVTDAVGTGTTLFAADLDAFEPRFGPGSREAHLDGGASEVPGTLTSLRQDVDDAGDLGRALALGVGPRTAAVLGRDEGGPPVSR